MKKKAVFRLRGEVVMVNVLCHPKKTGFLFAAAVFASCAGSPQTGNRVPPSPRPLWVTGVDLVYPDSEWVAAIGEGTDARTTEGAALTRLSQRFRVDVDAVTTINQQFVEVVTNTNRKTVSESGEITKIVEELRSTSTVSGLIGVRVESWTGDGRVFVIALMNRRECSERYSAMIQGNERVINQLKEEAGQYPETFEAFQILNLAHTIALLTDNFHSLLTVLDPSAVSRQPSYGNADAVRSLARSALRTIVVTVRVDGDVGGRIATAFTGSLNSRGFGTGAGERNPYTLVASFTLEDVDIRNPHYVFVRYILNYSLRTRAGVEIFSSSENESEGHRTASEARQRAIRTAEQSIGSTGFASNFDDFLESLL